MWYNISVSIQANWSKLFWAPDVSGVTNKGKKSFLKFTKISAWNQGWLLIHAETKTKQNWF